MMQQNLQVFYEESRLRLQHLIFRNSNLYFERRHQILLQEAKSSVMDSGDDLSSCGLLELAIVNEEAQLY
jgi:hypothetical protein